MTQGARVNPLSPIGPWFAAWSRAAECAPTFEAEGWAAPAASMFMVRESVRVYLKDSEGVRRRPQMRVTITGFLNPKRSKIPFQTGLKIQHTGIHERHSRTTQKGKPEG